MIDPEKDQQHLESITTLINMHKLLPKNGTKELRENLQLLVGAFFQNLPEKTHQVPRLAKELCRAV